MIETDGQGSKESKSQIGKKLVSSESPSDCVDKYGRNISPKEEKAQGMLNCSRLREEEEEEEEGKRKKEKGQERVVALISRDPIRTGGGARGRAE